jgi:hypothetical protein
LAATQESAALGHPLELDSVADDWQVALDGALDALDAADRAYAPNERGARRRALAHERSE